MARKKNTSRPSKRAKTHGDSSAAPPPPARSYEHANADSPARPEVGTQAQFRKKKPPATYRYDSSLAPELRWDAAGASVRDRAEELLRTIERAVAAGDPDSLAAARSAAEDLRRLQEPFLNWSGKTEHLSFDVPTLPLFVHERLSTEVIIESLTGHKKSQQTDLFDMFGDAKRPLAERVLKAYEYRDRWVNRMILGDSLVAMNSLLQYEGMGGQVQMIYIDPPYGVKFGSNFQPFVRKRDVKNNDDNDLTREPEMVQAYRDTWELGVHSYLTYLRDRLLLARDLLTPIGSVFVQISDENLHHVREVMDEVFGADNACAIIPFRKTTGANSPQARVNLIATTNDFLLWYARDIGAMKYRQLYLTKSTSELRGYNRIESPDGTESRKLTEEEAVNPSLVPAGWRVYQTENLSSTGHSDTLSQPFELNGIQYYPPTGSHWKTTSAGLRKLAAAGRLVARGRTLNYKRFLDDFTVYPLTHVWQDVSVGYGGDSKFYVVQTSSQVLERCMLMTTDPGDLVLDPTCGSGTTAYVAEQWGRRWITMDTSRVPLALARQRLLTASFPWYRLQDDARGPVSGFVYERRQNSRGEEIGGLVPHITLKSIANDEPPTMEVLVDRPEEDKSITRVTGPFVVEATIPTPVDWEGDGEEDSAPAAAEAHGNFVDRMLEVLRRSPRLQLGENRTLQVEEVRAPSRALVLNAEAKVKGTGEPVAFVFGPENGAVSEPLVQNALKEAHLKNYAQLFVVGFAIDPYARKLVDEARAMGLPAATYVQCTPDVVMGALLKSTRASQLFSVCGLPDIEIVKAKTPKGEAQRFQVKLLGLDTFDPVSTEARPTPGLDVPAWFLDHDYNGRVFRVSQAFFPRTGAWDALRKALRADFDESVFEHLRSDTSAPFEAGEHAQVAVKAIDERGNELVVTRQLG